MSVYQDRQLYIMHDTKNQGAFPVDLKTAARKNQEGFGVFWTVNKFKSEIRTKENLDHIISFAIDIDGHDKKTKFEKIKSGLIPSQVIETKSGFHVYFNMKHADVKFHKHFMIDRLIPFYGADTNARDICRILRAPNFFHHKDPSNPFLITEIFKSDAIYTQEQIAYFYKDVSETQAVEHRKQISEIKKHFSGSDDLWREIYEMDCESALERVSGRTCVNGETFTFRNTTAGKKNILVNGKSTSCFIDSQGRIGSSDNGGPTIATWINWYQHDWKKTVKYLNEIFTELPWKK
jgi:hypothetical protein